MHPRQTTLAFRPWVCEIGTMAEQVDNLVLEYLRRLDRKVDAIAADLHETRSALSGVVQILASQTAHMLRVEVRLGAIEKRLEMHDPALPG
jgi:predicted deacylase